MDFFCSQNHVQCGLLWFLVSLLCFKVWLPGKQSLSGCGVSTWSEQDKVTVAHAVSMYSIVECCCMATLEQANISCLVVNGETFIIMDSFEEAYWISYTSDGREGIQYVSVERLWSVFVNVTFHPTVPRRSSGSVLKRTLVLLLSSWCSADRSVLELHTDHKFKFHWETVHSYEPSFFLLFYCIG